jgi:hypothetical protein
MATEYFPEKWFLKDIHGHAGFGKFLIDQIKSEVPGEQVATLLQDFNQWALLDRTRASRSRTMPTRSCPTRSRR